MMGKIEVKNGAIDTIHKVLWLHWCLNSFKHKQRKMFGYCVSNGSINLPFCWILDLWLVFSDFCIYQRKVLFVHSLVLCLSIVSVAKCLNKVGGFWPTVGQKPPTLFRHLSAQCWSTSATSDDFCQHCKVIKITLWNLISVIRSPHRKWAMNKVVLTYWGRDKVVLLLIFIKNLGFGHFGWLPFFFFGQ